MGPDTTTGDIPDGGPGDTKHFADCSFGVTILIDKFSNPKHLFIGQLGHGMICTSGTKRAVNPMGFSVYYILPMGSVAKVFKKAVGRDSVEMTALCPWRRLTNESQKNKRVYCARIPPFLFTENHGRVIPRRPKNLIWSDPCNPLPTLAFPIRPHRSAAANIIGRKIRDGFENLWGCVKILVSHAVSLLVRGTSGLEPGQLLKQFPARYFYNTYSDFLPEEIA